MPSSSPRRKSIQRKAHLFTYMAVWWTLFSLLAFFLDTHLTLNALLALDANAFPAPVIWSIHLLLIGLALHFFKTEKKREALWFGDDDEILEPIPQQYDLEFERKQWPKNFIKGLKRVQPPLLCLTGISIGQLVYSYLTTNKIPDPLFAIIWLVLCLVLLMGQLLFESVYYYIVAASRNRAYEEKQQSQQTSAFSTESPLQ